MITVGEAADCDVRIDDLALDGSTSTSRIVRDGVDWVSCDCASPAGTTSSTLRQPWRWACDWASPSTT